MTEKIFRVENVSPIRFFGIDNSNLKLLKAHFPNLTLTSRGDEIKARGEVEELEKFSKTLTDLLTHLERYPNLTDVDVAAMLGSEPEETPSGEEGGIPDVLVYGPKGTMVKARTKNQKVLVSEALKNDVVFAVGPAGTGKTYTAVAIAVRALKQKEVKRIILARPAVEAGESLGFLPGDLKEKIDPYLKPLYDALMDMIPHDKYQKYLESGVIEVIPLAFMRGRSLNNCYIILDEAQNATETQLKMFLTRMGPNARMIINGDLSQVDLPKNQRSGLYKAIDILGNIRGISVVRLDTSDVVRHRLVKEIINAYDNNKDH
ncbi:MAG: PhoH family protein [Flavobacteriales bacterium]|nr:PhoH family protein [Bacteroidota bacterium]MCB9241077.1 PhoH family protein [Flavobacteriales bacterium]